MNKNEIMKIIENVITKYVKIDSIKYVCDYVYIYITYKDIVYSVFFDIDNEKRIFCHMMNLKTYDKKYSKSIDNIDKFDKMFKNAIETI